MLADVKVAAAPRRILFPATGELARSAVLGGRDGLESGSKYFLLLSFFRHNNYRALDLLPLCRR
jgi:hypothetical protein